MVGGKGSLPPPQVMKKAEEKKVIKPVEAPKVGGPGSLPPKPVLQKVEAKKIEAPKIEKKEAKMVGGPGSLPPQKKPAEGKKAEPAKKVEASKED